MKHYLHVILTALSFLACKATDKEPVKIPANFDWQGHRGCRGLMPENSIPAFLHALTFPQVTTLELDLAVSKDGQLIVSHEPFFNPAICLQPGGKAIEKSEEGKFLIYQLTAADIQGFDCGSLGNPRFAVQQKQKTYKPTFKEVVEAVRATKADIRWNIEIKSQPEWDGLRHPPVAEFARIVIAEIKKYGIEKYVTVQSFDPRALQEMHRQAPEITLAYLVENMDALETNLAKLDFIPAIFSPYYLTVSKKLVKNCHDKKMQIIPWTVNDVPAMRKLIRQGVDGIITDYPNLIKEVGAQ
jgi:glycerophosphoryl diester phosphodiesterase